MLVMIFAPGGVRQEPGGGVARSRRSAWMTFRRVTLPLAMPRHRRQHAGSASPPRSTVPAGPSPLRQRGHPAIYIWVSCGSPPSCRTCWRSALHPGGLIRPSSSVGAIAPPRLARHDVPPPDRRAFLVLAVLSPPARRRPALRIVAPATRPGQAGVSGVSRPSWRRRSANASQRSVRWFAAGDGDPLTPLLQARPMPSSPAFRRSRHPTQDRLQPRLRSREPRLRHSRGRPPVRLPGAGDTFAQPGTGDAAAMIAALRKGIRGQDHRRRPGTPTAPSSPLISATFATPSRYATARVRERSRRRRVDAHAPLIGSRPIAG